ncbi:S-layer homology domain-containing protein [Paenibacillus sp. TRM 82003]|nr:S-layer homology domain-containing protein [Paenibacillus sp. TRM 82003]
MNHNYRKPFAVLTSAALGVSLLLGTGAGTASAEDALLKLTFPDVAATHWAKSHVAKLASAGVVKGYTTGDFKPVANVTQQEAIVMVIRMIGLEDEALARNGDAVTGLGEDKFFSKYVVKAAEEGIINLGEETLAAGTGSQPWGQRPATREWLAKLVVRALGESPSATGGLTFADAADISSDAVGFVNRSQELELVNGIVENGATYFKPKGAVTRAQIATILSRADQYIADDPAKYASGFVTSLTGKTLMLQSASGVSSTLTLNTETLVFDEEGKTLSLSDLTEMKAVRIIYQGSQVYYIEVSDEAAAQLETIEGELQALDLTNMTLVLTLGNGTMADYKLASNVAVTNMQGSGLSLTQLTLGSDIRLQRIQGATEITSLKVLEQAFNENGSGVAVIAEQGKLTFTNAAGNIVSYSVAPDAELTLKGEPLTSLGEIQPGDVFDYEIRDSIVTAMNVTTQKYVMATGEFKGYLDGIITILVNGTEPQAKLLQKNAKVIVPGIENAAITDLQTGDMLQIRISGTTGQVDQISVTNRNVTLLRSVTIKTLEDNYLIVTDSDGDPNFFKIDKRTQFMMDGTTMTDPYFDRYVTEGRKVNLQVTGDQLVRLDITTKVTGKITAINSSTRNITVETAEGTSVTVPYNFSVYVEIPRQASASLADVNVGMNAELVMGTDSDTVSSIYLEKSVVFTLTSVTPNSRTFSAKDSQGLSFSQTLGQSSRILNKNGQSVSLDALPVGGPIVVNYLGRNIIAVQEPTLTRGAVTTLDVTGGKLTVTDFNKNASSFDLTKGITVKRGTTETYNASSLKLNDRVQMLTDAQDKPFLEVATVEIRKFSSYNASKNEITFKRVGVGDQTTYSLDPNVYVHNADGSLLTLNRLSDNDQVTFYMLNGKIIEIVK